MFENSSFKTTKSHSWFHYSGKYTTTGVGPVLLQMFCYHSITPFKG